MHILLWASLALLASARAATNKPSGIVEVDLVFPRNETYAPTAALPVIFSFQNPDLARLLGSTISLSFQNTNNMSDTIVTNSFDLRWANFSSSEAIYYEYRPFTDFNVEGEWMLKWGLGWGNCTEDSSDPEHAKMAMHWSYNGIRFAIKNASQKVEVASISEGCSEDQGFAFNITGTYGTPRDVDWSGGNTCAAVASQTPVPSPCRVQVGSPAASSILASMTDRLCENVSSPIDCPLKKNTAPRAVVGGVAGLMVVLGALSHFVL